MHSQTRVTFHGIYWRMSCGCCDRVLCFDDRAAAILAARAHAVSHDRGAGADPELVLVEDAIGHGRGETEDWALAPDPETVELDPAAGFHSPPPAFMIAKGAEYPVAHRN